MPETPNLSRQQKVATIDAYIAQGMQLLRRKYPLLTPVGAASGSLRTRVSPPTNEREDRDGWKNKMLEALHSVGGQDWAPLLESVGDANSELVVAIENLRALRTRVQAKRSTTLSERERGLLLLRSILLVWGDYFVDASSGASLQVEWCTSRDAAAFVAALPRRLRDVREYLADGHRSVAELDATAALIDDHLEDDSYMALGTRPETWHAGWALLTLAWWMADALGDPVAFSGRACCSFQDAKASRFQFLDEGGVSCPSCRSEVGVARGDENPGVDLASHQWTCSSCDISGYFPVRAAPTSAWAEQQLRERVETNAVTDVAPTLTTADFSWMEDPVLSRLARDDYEELGRCLAAGAYKAALLLAGSVCETMLLEMLERNGPAAAGYCCRRAEDFPDKASLEGLVNGALKLGLVTETSDLVPKVKNYRDLIHPNRARTSTIKVDAHTAGLLAHVAVIICRDLADAVADGRAGEFASS